jgi:alkanesulfonate monooxygenase SsuD/methylene tetrahydromethanopterin reductase-like flavin-dependent oxidoreductase (luciferase family)
VFIEPDDIAARMRDVRERCDAEGRDPATLRFSLYERDELMRDRGQARVDRLARMAELGLDRLVAFPTRWSPTLEAQASFAEDCRAAGIELAPDPRPAAV